MMNIILLKIKDLIMKVTIHKIDNNSIMISNNKNMYDKKSQSDISNL